MEARSDLATGYARTASARSRVRRGWEGIALRLNSDGNENGCVKNWKQWAKYWKDKKAAVKRKANMAVAARQRTGGGVDVEVVELTEQEQKILTIVGGPSFATGDRHLSINPFPETDNIGTVPLSSNQSESIILQGIAGPSGAHSHNTTVDLDVSLEWENSAVAVVGEGSVREELESPPAAQRAAEIDDEDETVSQNDRVTAENPERESPLSPSARTDGTRRRSLPSQGAGRSPLHRRRVLQGARTQGGESAARRRLLRRSPPSQRRSEMASLTERFIAIEERRADTELAIARSLDTFAQGYRLMAEAINKLSNTVENVAAQVVEAIQQPCSRH